MPFPEKQVPADSWGKQLKPMGLRWQYIQGNLASLQNERISDAERRTRVSRLALALPPALIRLFCRPRGGGGVLIRNFQLFTSL